MNSRRLTIASAKPNQLYVRNLAQINPVMAQRLRLCHASAWRHLLRAIQPADQRPGQSLLLALFERAAAISDVRFSNRPFGVKHFQTIHQCDVDVARGLVLLFGIGTGAFPSWDSRTRRNNLLVGLAVEERRVQADIRTHLIHRPARDIFPPLGGALVFSYRVHAAAVACSLVQQNSVPSTHMRCMITASRRAKATIAFFIPRRLAICMAHALSQDHFFECIML